MSNVLSPETLEAIYPDGSHVTCPAMILFHQGQRLPALFYTIYVVIFERAIKKSPMLQLISSKRAT
jgi:hypothetical protein